MLGIVGLIGLLLMTFRVILPWLFGYEVMLMDLQGNAIACGVMIAMGVVGFGSEFDWNLKLKAWCRGIRRVTV